VVHAGVPGFGSEVNMYIGVGTLVIILVVVVIVLLVRRA
jgi:hypothetical protein